MFIDEEIYPNQPLADVACEVRFRGDMQVECERHLFWNRIRDEYPDILVPNAQQGQPVALQHYRFRNPQSQRIVSVAINSLAFSESQYSGHRLFIDEFCRLAKIFTDVFQPGTRITRVGWRYINVMPFLREGDHVPINRMLNLTVSLPSEMFQSTTGLDLSWNGRCLGGEVAIRMAAATRKEAPQQEAIVLDIDFGHTGDDLQWRQLSELLEEARRQSRGIFEGLITESYRKYLRGEGI